MLSRRQAYHAPFIKDPAQEVTSKANLRIRTTVLGAQVANQRRRKVVASSQAQIRLGRVLAWLAFYDDTPKISDVRLTELNRGIALTDTIRGS